MLKRNYGGDHNWPTDELPTDALTVDLPGVETAQAWNKVDEADVIESCRDVAVLEVESGGQPFHPGFVAHDGTTKYLAVPQKLDDGRYGMRVGREPVRFWARSVDGAALPIKLVTMTSVDDEGYASLFLY